MYCDLCLQYIKVRKLFKDGHYLRKYGNYLINNTNLMLVDVSLSPIVWSGLLVVDAIFFAWSSDNKLSVSSLACELEKNLNLYILKDFQDHSNEL